MFDFDETLIDIQSCQQLSALPDLLTMETGTRVRTRAQWEQRRAELYGTAVELQYGTIPPNPEFLETEPLDDGSDINCYRITTGTRANPVSFIMRVIWPREKGRYPVIVDGDLCWRYFFDRDFIHTAIDQNVILVLFNRTELVPDCRAAGRTGQAEPASGSRRFCHHSRHQRCRQIYPVFCHRRHFPAGQRYHYSGRQRHHQTA